MRELRGKVAVVTGAASGIGYAMAGRFAREGMKVVLADIEASALAQAHEAITRTGAEAIAVLTDVSRAEQVEALARSTFEAFGTAHVICNNAGVGSRPTTTWNLSRADWEWTLGVDLWRVIHGVRALVPRMVAQRGGARRQYGKVLSAIVEERFWVITHSNTKPMIEKRMRGILDETAPQFDVLRAGLMARRPELRGSSR